MAEASKATGVPIRFLAAVMKQESGFNPRATSASGAMGLMQLMPDTAKQLGVTDPYDIRQSIMAGARYLAEQYARFRDPSLALAAYNAGPGAVEAARGIPAYAETRNYVASILGMVNAQ